MSPWVFTNRLALLRTNAQQSVPLSGPENGMSIHLAKAVIANKIGYVLDKELFGYCQDLAPLKMASKLKSKNSVLQTESTQAPSVLFSSGALRCFAALCCSA